MDGAGNLWRGWRQIEEATGFCEKTLAKLADGQGLPVFRVGNAICMRPAAWAQYLESRERAAGSGK